MKLILVALFLSLNVSAQSEPCPRGCWTPDQQNPTPVPAPRPAPRPTPEGYKCEIEMTDRYERALYLYTGTAETYDIACRIASERCLRDVRLGYGGAGAMCWILE